MRIRHTREFQCALDQRQHTSYKALLDTQAKRITYIYNDIWCPLSSEKFKIYCDFTEKGNKLFDYSRRKMLEKSLYDLILFIAIIYFVAKSTYGQSDEYYDYDIDYDPLDQIAMEMEVRPYNGKILSITFYLFINITYWKIL